MEPLKEMFNKRFAEELSAQIKKVYPKFEDKVFVKSIHEQLSPLELNQRMRLFSTQMRAHLPEAFPKALSILKQTATKTKSGYTSLIYPDFVALYGKNHFELALDALKFFTVFGSSEFAIREFLRLDFDKSMGYMHAWSEDSNEHVRRLSSEGSRPRLPWSFKLDQVIQKPEHTLPLLNRLKTDSSLYVRKSVANHLNDISKDHPTKLLNYLKHWDLSHPHTSWIVKRACRTLIKKGDSESLSLFKFEKKPKVILHNFKLHSKKIRIGDDLFFSFDLNSQKSSGQKLAIDYRVHYPKPSGSLLPKVFKLKEVILAAKQSLPITKKHPFKHFSTRRQHPGKHLLEIQINGLVHGSIDFVLVD
ncbi:MAG: DNA alkylation repair protein [Bacteroidia bacterium]|nr:DNA alkylation repair protein [Bacteroidia bacterium]